MTAPGTMTVIGAALAIGAGGPAADCGSRLLRIPRLGRRGRIAGLV